MAVSRPFQVDPVLTALTIAYRNAGLNLIADRVLPRVPVGGEKFSWTEHPIAERFTVPETEVGRRGRVNRVEFSGIPRTDQVKDYGLEDAIPNTDIQEAEAMRNRGLGTFDPVKTATEGLTDLILTDREVRAAEVVQNPDNYAPSRRLVLSGTDKFSDYDNSKPIEVLKAGFNGTLIFRPNTMVIGREGWSVLSSHPQIVNAVRGQTTSRGIVSPEEFIRLFAGEGLRDLLIGEAFANVARKGQEASIQRIWGKSIELLYVNPQARPEGTMSWGMTAQYGTRIAGFMPDSDIGLEGGTVVRTGERVREFVMAKDLGYLMQNAF